MLHLTQTQILLKVNVTMPHNLNFSHIFGNYISRDRCGIKEDMDVFQSFIQAANSSNIVVSAPPYVWASCCLPWPQWWGWWGRGPQSRHLLQAAPPSPVCLKQRDHHGKYCFQWGLQRKQRQLEGLTAITSWSYRVRSDKLTGSYWIEVCLAFRSWWVHTTGGPEWGLLSLLLS